MRVIIYVTELRMLEERNKQMAEKAKTDALAISSGEEAFRRRQKLDLNVSGEEAYLRRMRLSGMPVPSSAAAPPNAMPSAPPSPGHGQSPTAGV